MATRHTYDPTQSSPAEKAFDPWTFRHLEVGPSSPQSPSKCRNRRPRTRLAQAIFSPRAMPERARARQKMGRVKRRYATLRFLPVRSACLLAPSRTAPASDACELRARVLRSPTAAVVGSLAPLPQRRPSLPRCHPLGQNLTTCPQRLLCLHPHDLAAPRSARGMQETRHRSTWGNTADCWSCLRPRHPSRKLHPPRKMLRRVSQCVYKTLRHPS